MNEFKKLSRDIAELTRRNELNMIIPDPELAPEAVWVQEMLEESLEWRKDRLLEVHNKLNQVRNKPEKDQKAT